MRKILIVIDMQNDFIDGSLGTKEAVGIVEAVRTKILGYDKKDRFATMDTHKENYLNTQEGKNLPVSHCIENTVGWELNEKIAPLIDPKNIFKKPTFGSVDLANKIAEIAKKEEIEITREEFNMLFEEFYKLKKKENKIEQDTEFLKKVLMGEFKRHYKYKIID